MIYTSPLELTVAEDLIGGRPGSGTAREGITVSFRTEK